MNPVQGILLAAGTGRRYDPTGEHDKLLAPMADGEPVLWHSARALAEALPGVLAVVQPGQPARVRVLERAGCRVIECAEAAAGMGEALAAAVRSTADRGAWVVALADMPWVPSDIVRQVAERLGDGRALVAPVCHGRRGHPVGFGAGWYERLAALTGDQGARALLADADVQPIDCDDDGVLRDVDTPADLRLSRPSA